MENKTIVRTLILLVILFALYVLTSAARNLVPPEAQEPEPVACTLDAKLCPDGSYVGRVPPRCEFAACPSEAATSTSLDSSDQAAGLGSVGDLSVGTTSPIQE